MWCNHLLLPKWPWCLQLWALNGSILTASLKAGRLVVVICWQRHLRVLLRDKRFWWYDRLDWPVVVLLQLLLQLYFEFGHWASCKPVIYDWHVVRGGWHITLRSFGNGRTAEVFISYRWALHQRVALPWCMRHLGWLLLRRNLVSWPHGAIWLRLKDVAVACTWCLSVFYFAIGWHLVYLFLIWLYLHYWVVDWIAQSFAHSILNLLLYRTDAVKSTA